MSVNSFSAQNPPLTTKGDLYTYSTIPTRLAVGNNGEQIVADSAATTGLRYSATPSASNPILNSAFQVWQRGTSISQTASTVPYTADRWQAYNGANQANTISRQATGDTTNLPNIQYNARFQRNSGQTGTADTGLFQSMESVNSIPFAGKTVTVSFYARRGSNYSATSNLLNSNLYTGTGTDQNILTGYTGSGVPGAQTNTLTTTWQRFTMSVFIASTVTEIALGFFYAPTGTASTNDYFDLTGVQIDIGSVALPFRTYAATIQGELAACQRYLPAFRGEYSPLNGWFTSTTNGNWVYNFAVPARVAPTGITISAVGDFQLVNKAIAAVSPTAIAWNYGGTSTASVSTTHTAGSPTSAQGEVGFLRASTSSAFILFTGCEL